MRQSSAVGLHQLLVGSEGTLAVVTEAELGLVPRPKGRGLLVPQFSSLGRGDGRRGRLSGNAAFRRRS